MLLFLGLVLAIAAMAGFVVYRQALRVAALAAARERLSASLDELGAALASGPAALYLFGPTGERFFPGTLSALGALPRSFADLLDRFPPEDLTALDRAVARLRTDGTGFALRLRLAESGAAVDIGGQRLAANRGDAIWFADGAARDSAERERLRLRTVLDALPIPVWRRNAAFLLTGANRAFAAAIGAAADASSPDQLREFADAESARSLAESAAKTGRASERRHVIINGSRRWVELSEIKLESGESLGFARDLTDLEAAEAELKRHEAGHAAVLNRVTSAIAIYGADRRLSYFNFAFAQLWRLEEDWLSNHPLIDEVMDRLRERRRLPEVADFRAFRRNLQAQFTSLIAPQEELLHLPDDKTLRLVVSPHPQGGLIFAYEDVTDRFALERSYNTAIEVQRETLDHLYEGIAVFGSDGRLKLSNPAYAKMWGLTPEDLAGEPHVSQLTDKFRGFLDDGGDWPDRKARLVGRLTADRASSTTLNRQDGSMLQAVTLPLPDGNTLLSYLDVTDSRRVENALRERTEALEAAGRLKSEFLANVSYELRTPLTSITGYAEMLTGNYAGELAPRQMEYAANILESAQAFTRLVDDILDLATIEAGYMELDTSDVDIYAMLQSVLTLQQAQARSLGLRLEFDCPATIGTVPGDERRLKQVVFSLVSNALKFTPAGGSVTVAARREGERVALVVSDTGIGVAEEDQARVFETFERGHGRQSGAGLGLSLVKSFIELHGGTVELRSSPGEGTTVTCWLHAELPMQKEGVRSTPYLRAVG
ncbi:MAG TPA: ATP-binding protein [Stellaceae bacterium]|nr:ATP-binding protein [Stellaceae bacterium]